MAPTKDTRPAQATTTPAPTASTPTKDVTTPEEAAVASAEPQRTGPLFTEHGRTTIADIVVSKIAGIATREVNGVHAVGGTTARTVGALRERIGTSTNLSQGVSVEVGERQAAVDLDIVADYGVAMIDLADGVRSNVMDSIQRMTGLEVTEVNITVHDVYLESADDDTDVEQRGRVE